jgi:microcystin-dependent protein
LPPPLLGEIKLFATGKVPAGWAPCDGQILPIAQNPELFKLLKSKFGGDGEATFSLPDLRGRVPVHIGNGLDLPAFGGGETHQLLAHELPAHTHSLVANDSPAPDVDGTQPGQGRRLARSNPGDLYAPPGSLVAMSSAAVSSVGGGQSHENMQPSLALTYCIALQGTVPEHPRRRRFWNPKWWKDLIGKDDG